MAGEIRAVVAAEEIIERNPRLLGVLAEFAANSWRRVTGAAAESGVVSKVAPEVEAGAARGESVLANAQRALSNSAAVIERTNRFAVGSATHGTVNPFGTFGSFGTGTEATSFLTPRKLATVAGLSTLTLGLAGCGDDDKSKQKKSTKPGAAADSDLPGSGADLGPGGNPNGIRTTPDAPVVKNGDGVPVLTGDPSRPPSRDYPGGIGPDVKTVQKLIDNVPGKEGYAAQAAFALFLENYNSRVGESQIPKSLPLLDLPTSAEKDRQFVWGNIDHWRLNHDSDLYLKQDYGPLGKRDMRPNTDQSPGGGKLPPMFYAVGLDKEGKPVDVLQYYNPGTGPLYREQYQFKYEQVQDGRMRVTVYDWMASDQTSNVGPKQKIGKTGTDNTLEGVSQYYFDATTGKCTQAQYYNGWTFLRPRETWKPQVDMKFDAAGHVSISDRDPRSGEMTPYYTPANGPDAIRTVRTKAGKLNFFNLLGPALPELPNGQ